MEWLKKVLTENNLNSTLTIPNNINDNSVSMILKNWFKENELDIKQNNTQLICDEENIKKNTWKI